MNTPNNCNHEWEETYTGFECKHCKLQVPEWYFDPPDDNEPEEPDFTNCFDEYDFGELGYWRFHD